MFTIFISILAKTPQYPFNYDPSVWIHFLWWTVLWAALIVPLIFWISMFLFVKLKPPKDIGQNYRPFIGWAVFGFLGCCGAGILIYVFCVQLPTRDFPCLPEYLGNESGLQTTVATYRVIFSIFDFLFSYWLISWIRPIYAKHVIPPRPW